MTPTSARAWRRGSRQRQAGPSRFGEAIGRNPDTGFTLSVLLEVGGGDVVGLRDAALLSLGYDAGLPVSELAAVVVEAIDPQEDGSGVLELPRSKADQEGQGAMSGSRPTRCAAWPSGGMPPRSGWGSCSAAWPRPGPRSAPPAARTASVSYRIGEGTLTPAAIRLIIMRTALAAADQGLVTLMGADLADAVSTLSTPSLRVGLTHDLFASGENSGPIAQALRWNSTATALRYGRKLAPSSNAAARMLKGIRK